MMNYISGQQLLIVHKTTTRNIQQNWTYLDCPTLNDKPDAFLTVSKKFESTNGKYHEHPIGVWYDTNARKWTIFNQNKKPMEVGLTFNVSVACCIVLHASMDPLPGTRRTPDNILEPNPVSN